MSIEVANLLARIQMVADGVPEVLRATESVRKNLEGMGETGAAAANKISENQIKAAVALGRYENAVIKAAEAQASLAEAEAKTGVDAEVAAVKVAELTDKLNELAKARAGGTATASDLSLAKSLEDQLKGYQEVTKAAEAVRNTQHRVLSAGERLVVANRRLGDETVQTGKRFRILTTEITGLVSAMRTGELGSTLLARAFIRLGDAAKAAGSLSVASLGLIGIAIAGVLAGFAALKAGAQAAGDFIKISHLPELSDELEEIADRANVAGASLKGMSLEAGNIFRSLDIRNADAATDAVARLAEQLRFLTPDADFAKSFDTILKGITSGNLDSVARTFGLSAAALKEALGNTEGLSDTEIALRSINALLAETPKHADRIQTAINNQVQGWEQVEQSVADMKSVLGEAAAPGLSEIAEAVTDIVEGLKPLAGPLGKQVSSFFAGIALVIEGIANTAAPFIKVIEAVEEMEAPPWLKALIAGSQGGLIGIGGALASELNETKNASRTAADGLGEFRGEVDRLPPPTRTAEQAIKDFYDQINNSNSIVDSIKSLSVAWHEMEADLTPATAANAFQSLGKVIEMVVTDGIGSLELLRLQAEAAGKIGFATPEQVQAAMTAYDAIEGALSPIAEEAGRVRARLTQDVAGGFGTTQSAAEAATGTINTYIAALNSIPKTVSTNIIQNFSSTGGIVQFGGTGLPPRTGITAASTAVREAGAATTSASKGLSPATLGAMQDADRAEGVANQQAAAVARGKTLSEELGNVFDVFGLGKGGGGGGGGGGSSDLGATLEQIRALISAVNQAVAIGINGGVRIGTSGNVVPFMPGTFLNASGNQIAVEQIVIRGVWDFADPATRRQIVKELESALRELKAEL